MKLTQSDQRLKALLVDTISLLCKNGLEYENEFSVEALVVLTVDNERTFHASVKEDVLKPGSTLSSPTSSISVRSPKDERAARKRTRDVVSPPQELPTKMAPKSPKTPRTEDKRKDNESGPGYVVVKRNVQHQPIVITPAVIKQEPKEKEISKRSTRSSTPAVTSLDANLGKSTGTSPKCQTTAEQPVKEEKPEKLAKEKEKRDMSENNKNRDQKVQRTKEEEASKRPTRSRPTPAVAEVVKEQEKTPKRATRSSTPDSVESSPSQPMTTRRANKIAAEQSKIQTRGVAKRSLTPVSTQKERPKRNASPATANVTKKEKLVGGRKETTTKSSEEVKGKNAASPSKSVLMPRSRSVEKANTGRQLPEVSQDETPSKDKTENTRQSSVAPARPAGITAARDQSPMFAASTKDTRPQPMKEVPTQLECETISIDTRGVKEITRIVAVSSSKGIEGGRVGKVTPIMKETHTLPFNYKQLKKQENTPSDSVNTVAAKEYVKMAFASVHGEEHDENNSNGYEEYEVNVPVTQYTYGSGQKLVVGGKMSMSKEQNPKMAQRQSCNNVVVVSETRNQQTPTLTESAKRQIAKQAMGIIDPTMVKRSSGSEGPIKVNVGLHQGAAQSMPAPSSIADSSLNVVVQHVMGNIDPMKVKNTTGSEGPIKVNFGLHQVKIPQMVNKCPSCQVIFQSSEELYKHNCEDQDQGNRKGTVFRCKICSSMFMREENFKKHFATCS